jgi:probable phosphoglycerate mutase
MRLILCELLGIDLDRYRSAFPHVINCALTTLRLPASANARRGPHTVALLGFNVPPSSRDPI